MQKLFSPGSSEGKEKTKSTKWVCLHCLKQPAAVARRPYIQPMGHHWNVWRTYQIVCQLVRGVVMKRFSMLTFLLSYHRYDCCWRICHCYFQTPLAVVPFFKFNDVPLAWRVSKHSKQKRQWADRNVFTFPPTLRIEITDLWPGCFACFLQVKIVFIANNADRKHINRAATISEDKCVVWLFLLWLICC